MKNGAPAAVCDERSAVEDDAVVSADEVDVDHGQSRSLRAVLDHRAALPHLRLVEGRGVRRDDDGRSHLDNLVRRVVRVEALAPERLVVPEVLADDDAKFFPPRLEQAAALPRPEVARVVEHVVLRQQGLVGEAQKLAVAYDCRRVVELAPFGRAGRPHRADDRR